MPNLSQNTKVTLGAILGSAVPLILAALWVGGILLNLRDDIKDMRSEAVLRSQVVDQKFQVMDQRSAQRWTASMMKIYYLESKEAGFLVDPDPIIDRYGNQNP